MSSLQITAAKAAAPLNAAVSTAQVFAQKQNPMIAATLSIPGSMRLEAKRFRAVASGVLTGSAAGVTAQPFIASGSSLIPASNEVLAAPAAATIAAASAPWWVAMTIQFDSTSGKLQGTFESCINNVPTAPAALAAVLTGLNGDTEPVFQLVAGVTFSTAAAGNIATLAEFVVEG